MPFGTIKKWNEKLNWQERVAEYDAEMARQKMLAAQQEARRLAKRRLSHATTMQDAGLLVIAKSNLSELSPEQARALLPTAVKLLDRGMMLERLEQGESSENISIQAVAPKKPLVSMTDEELDEYLNRLEKLA